MKSKTESIAKLISLVLNPFVLFAPLQILLFILSNEINNHLPQLILIIVLQALIPCILIIIFIKSGFISDFDITKKEERPIYFTIMTVLFTTAALISMFDSAILVINLALAISMLIVDLLSPFWKISGHMASDSILLIGLGFIDPNIYLLSPLILLVAWSRVYLGKHTKDQVFGGTLMGIFILFAVTALVQFK